MRLIRKNVEREAEGSAAEKLISDGFTPMKEATPDTVPEEKKSSGSWIISSRPRP